MTLQPEHWRRDAPTFYNFLALERTATDRPEALAGVSGALMSMDRETGCTTHVVEIPPGWRQAADGVDASLEMFMLSGDIRLDDDSVRSGGVVNVPQAGGGAELSSEHGGLALCFWNPDQPAYSPPYTTNRIRRVWDLEWQSSLGEGVHGELHKSLRVPDPTGDGYDGGPGGFLRLAHLEPHLSAPFEHVHDECWEEIIFIAGDTMLADEGFLTAGSVVGHPPGWWHGPFATRNGAIIVNHTDAPMGFPWPPRDYPGQEELVSTYLDAADWSTPPQHTPWEDVDPALHRVQDEHGYQAWSQTESGAEYNDRLPRDVVTTFRQRHAGSNENN